MSARRARIRSRTTTVLVVAAAHGLVVWVIWRAHVAPIEEPEAFISTLFFLPATARDTAVHSRAAGAQAPADARPAATAIGPQPILVPQVSEPNTAISLPRGVPGAGIDWSAQIPGAAEFELTKEKKQREQLGALMRKFQVPEDPRNPRQSANRDFRWYDAGIHRIDTRSWIPVLHVNDRCALLAFIMPLCAIGHIDSHDDLFKNMVTVLDENEATARPNDAP